MDVTQRCQWRWLHQGIGLAMRVSSPRGGYRNWYVIHPLDADRAATRAVLRGHQQPMPLPQVQVYHVRHLEAQRLALLQILQHEDADVQCLEEFFAYGDAHLSDRLWQRGLSVATFYPLTTAAARDDHGVRTLRPVRL
jgi:hypothetical protein